MVLPLYEPNNAGKRYSLPNSRIMIHQPLGGAQGGQTDIDIQVISELNIMSMLHPIIHSLLSSRVELSSSLLTICERSVSSIEIVNKCKSCVCFILLCVLDFPVESS